MEKKIITNPVKVIRAKCLDCCCGSYSEVEQCSATRCALYPFRMGKNPYRTKRELTPEQIERQISTLARSRQAIRQGVAENETT